jgi:probable F420-dependent oxidoreductase
MRLHAVLPNESADEDPDQIVALAGHAERYGFDTVWLPDHILPPADYGATYGGVYEPLIMLAAIASVTQRMRLGTSVLILPLRDPFLLAKQAATLQRLSGDRVILGVGTGWEPSEFTGLGLDFANRGARTDEALRLIGHLHTVGHGPFDGHHYGFTTGVFAPRLSTRMPLMVGGTSNAALRRAAQFADLWQGVGLDPSQFHERVMQLRRLSVRPIEVGTRIEVDRDDSFSDAVTAAEAFADAGADHIAVWFGSLNGYERRMERFARTFHRHDGPR